MSKAEGIHHVHVLPVAQEGGVKDVWGDLEEGGPNYRALGWVRASVLLMKIQIGLGVLAIVSLTVMAFDRSHQFCILLASFLVFW